MRLNKYLKAILVFVATISLPLVLLGLSMRLAWADGGDCEDASQGSIGPSSSDSDGGLVASWTETGQVITKVCVKAGRPHHQYTSNVNDGCYEISGMGTDTVTVTRVNEGPECKGISHIDVYWEGGQGDPSPSPSTSPVPSPSPSPSASPSPSPSPSVRPSPSTSPTPRPSLSPSPSPESSPSPTPTTQGEVLGLSLNDPGCGINFDLMVKLEKDGQPIGGVTVDFEYKLEHKHVLSNSDGSAQAGFVYKGDDTATAKASGFPTQTLGVTAQEDCPSSDEGEVLGTTTEEPIVGGQVLGASTLAAAGYAEGNVFSIIYILGLGLIAAGFGLYVSSGGLKS